MAKFRKKPVVIDAVQWTGDNLMQMMSHSRSPEGMAKFGPMHPGQPLIIHTLEGDMTAGIGDWIVMGVKGEFYPIKNEIFLETYEPA